MEKGKYHHENLQQELIEAGVKIVAREGAGALSLRRLAAECGVSHAAPYKHFKNKEEILQALTGHVLGLFSESLQQRLVTFAAALPDIRLLELGKCYVEFMLDHPDYLDVLFFRNGPSQATSEWLKSSVQTRRAPLSIFRETAIAYLDFIHAPPESYEYHIASLWALVHGLTLMLAHRNWVPSEPPLEAVERALRTQLRMTETF